MSNVESFKYEIQLSVKAQDFTPEVRRILKDAQTQVDKESVNIKLNGDLSDIIKQLTDLKKIRPDLDLTKGIHFELADIVKNETDQGKEIMEQFTTFILNAVNDAVSNIGSIKDAIKDTEKVLDSLKKRKANLVDKDALQAFEDAEERFNKAAETFGDQMYSGAQHAKRRQAAAEMKAAYQDMKNYAKEAGKDISKNMNIMAFVDGANKDRGFKDLDGKFVTLAEHMSGVEVNSSFKKDLADIEVQIVATENKLHQLRQDLERAENPELRVNGKLADNFLEDLQRQLDEMSGLEVKVTPVVDKDAKIEVKADIKPNDETTTSKTPRKLDKAPEGWTRVEGAMTAPEGYEWYSNGKPLRGGEYESALVRIAKAHEEAAEAAKDQRKEEESLQQQIQQEIKPQKTQEELRQEFERTRESVRANVDAQEGYFEALLEKAKESKLSYEEVIAVVTDAERVSSDMDHIYKSQSGSVTSGNYSYIRYGDLPNSVESYRGVVSTDKNGNLVQSERLIVNYDKLLDELLRKDKEIYKIEQDMLKPEADTDGLQRKLDLTKQRYQIYEDLIRIINSNPEYKTAQNQSQLDYIQQRREAQVQILKLDTEIAQVESQNKEDAKRKEDIINQLLEERLDAFKKILQCQIEIAKLDPEKNSMQIYGLQREQSSATSLYIGLTQRLKNLDAEKAKEQELVVLDKERVDAFDKIYRIKNKNADTNRQKAEASQEAKIKTLLEERLDAYKKMLGYRLQIANADPNKPQETKNAKDQETIYKNIVDEKTAELEKLDAVKLAEQDVTTILKEESKYMEKLLALQAQRSDSNLQDNADKLVANYKELSKLKVEQENLRHQGIPDSDSYMEYIQDRITAIEQENKELQKLTYTKEQDTKITKAEEEQVQALSKAQLLNAEADNKVNEAGKAHQQVVDNTRAALQKQASALTNNGKLMKAYGDQVNALIEEIKNPTTTLERLQQIRIELNKISAEAIIAGNSGKSFLQILKQRATSLVAYLGTFASFYRVIGYVRTAFSTIKDLDTQLVDLRKTTAMNTTQLNEYYKTANKVAKEFGVTTSEIISQSAAWSRLGYNTAEASAEMAKLSSQFASISPGMTTDVAQSGLVSIMKAWNVEVDDVKNAIMDNINTLGNNFAETNEDIINGMERSAAALSAVGTSYQDAFALFTGGKQNGHYAQRCA